MGSFPILEIKRQVSNIARIGQRGILPTTIKTRSFGDIVLLSNLASASGTISNGDQVVFTVTLTAKDDARTIVTQDISLFVDSVVAANHLPGGTAIDETQLQVVFQGNDFEATDTFNTKTIIFVRNISAGASKVVILRARARAIINKPIA